MADLQRVLERLPADVVVADQGFLGAPVLHELGGPPWATIGVSPLAIPSRDLAPFGPGLPPLSGWRDRVRASLMATAKRTLLRDVEKYHTDLRARLGLPPAAGGVFGMASPFLYLHSGTQAFDYPQSDLPSHVRYVGPLASGGGESAEKTDWKGLAAGRPIVVLTQGTHPGQRDDHAHRHRPQGVGERGCACNRDWARTSVPLPANASCVSYADLLPHASAMVTNGGFGGVQIALTHVVPLAVAGDTEDKPEIGARVAWSGAGINLKTGSPTESALRSAVHSLLAEAKYRDGVQRIAKDYAHFDAPRFSADLIEAFDVTSLGRRRDHSIER